MCAPLQCTGDAAGTLQVFRVLHTHPGFLVTKKPV